MPPIISDGTLIEVKDDEKCCSELLCDNEGKALYYNYHCIGCYDVCHRECSRDIGQTYDKERSMMTYPSSYPYSELRWIKGLVASLAGDSVPTFPIHHVICGKCNVKTKRGLKKCALTEKYSLVKCVNQ